MALKDRNRYYAGLGGTIPNTVSRNALVGDRSFVSVVAESGKPILDAEVNLRQDLQAYRDQQIRTKEMPSGWTRAGKNRDSLTDYILGTIPSQFIPIGGTDGGFPAISVDAVDGTLLDAFMLPNLDAFIAGYPVTVEFVNTSAPGYNLVQLETARVYDGTNATFKRTDFVFLEAWLALVAPSPRATGYVQVIDETTLVGSLITINGNVLTAVAGAPGVDEFQVDAGSALNTASNIATAINAVGNSFAVDVVALASNDTVIIRAMTRGTVGNAITLTVTPSVGGNIVASGANLTGGADRINKPSAEQGKVYRHGNVQSHADTWLDDEIVDPTIDIESSQRVQLQYRIRVTGTTEGVNFKTHPDGFSNPTTPLAQGGQAAPVAAYPFVPADETSSLLNSSAVEFGQTDSGLWIAGDGSETAAQDLNSLDGFVYAIPVCLVFRHNNVSDPTAAVKGFDPVNNANGAPMYQHTGYSGAVGAIPAGVSDRPDGEYADVIQQHHIMDSRRHVSASGFNLASEIQYQIQSLLDGSLRTWAIDTASKQTLGGDSGDVATQPLVCNEVGRGSGVGGTAPFSGDTDRGVLIRNFDHVARRFADQPVIERAVFAFYPGDRPDAISQGNPATYAHGTVNPGKYVVKTGGGTPVSEESWFEGDALHLDLSQLNVSTLGGLFQGTDGGGSSAAGLPSATFTAFAPAGTRISDVLSIYHDDGHYDIATNQELQPTLIEGLGTTHLVITLDANDTAVTGGVEAAITGFTINAAGTGYSLADPLVISAPDLGWGVQAVAEVDGIDGFGGVTSILITNAGSGYTTIPVVTVGGAGANADVTAILQQYRMAGGLDSFGVPVVNGSPRRVFVEVEITYPAANGLTDTPDLALVPDPVVYDGTGAGPGPVIETSTTQRPSDFEGLLEPRFRETFREVSFEYVVNDTQSQAPGMDRPGTPIGGVDTETLVSRSNSSLVFPRRVFGSTTGVFANSTTVRDTTDPVNTLRVVNEAQTEFGSSSRRVVLSTTMIGQAKPLTGTGHTLCEIEYFAQDPIPNFGPAGAGYQLSVYYRSNAPQTAGTKEADITTTAGGVLPTTLTVEPLLAGSNLWTGQTGSGSPELGFPYGRALDQIAINDGSPLTGLSPNQIAGTIKEWYFQATAEVSVGDFDAGTGLLSLHPFVSLDTTSTLTLGGATNDEKPRKDAEFRAYYPFTDADAYRPTVMGQPLYGATRHKVFAPLLVRALDDVPGIANGLLFRKGEVLLVVFSRFAEIDAENTIRFIDPVGDNRTCAAVYKTRNLLLMVGN